MLASSHGDNIGNAIGNSFASLFKFLFNKSTFAQLTTADRQRRFVLVMSVTILMGALVAVAYALGASQQANTGLSTRPLETKLTGQASPSPADTSQATSSNSNQSNSDSANTSNATSVTVNGHSVDVPTNGSFSKTVTSNDSTTTVDGVSSQSSSASGGTVSNNSSTTVDVNSRSN